MYAKIMITGSIEVVTGLHIGTSGAFSAIGAVDSPVVRDTLEGKPMIPGSSLKGKMRSLLAKEYNETVAKSPKGDCERLLRLFGCSDNPDYRMGRLLFMDMVLANADELRKRADGLTEIKFENNINRITAMADPRQIERVIRGSRFDMDMIYEKSKQEPEELIEDFETVREGFKLLQSDYLGGSGSRGYGRVSFSRLCAKTVVGKLEDGLLERINKILAEVGG